MEPTVRDASAADLDAIHAIDVAAFAQPWARASFVQALADWERSIAIVLENDGEVRAFGVAWSVGDEGEIATLAVHADSRGRGFGEQIIQSLMQRLEARGVTSVFLEVRPSNHVARRLYTRLGFREVGKRPNYYANGETALILRLNLNE